MSNEKKLKKQIERLRVRNRELNQKIKKLKIELDVWKGVTR